MSIKLSFHQALARYVRAEIAFNEFQCGRLLGVIRPVEMHQRGFESAEQERDTALAALVQFTDHFDNP